MFYLRNISPSLSLSLFLSLSQHIYMHAVMQLQYLEEFSCKQLFMFILKVSHQTHCAYPSGLTNMLNA